MALIERPDKRSPDQLRTIRLEPGFAPHATGSVLAAYGDTRVICAATLEAEVPGWMKKEERRGGWLTAEYSMLPYSTHERKRRDIARGKLDGRTVEIQRLIGRSLRAVTDLSKLPGYTLWLDCDVLQADGGTRTAAITGAWVAARLAVSRLMACGKLGESPFTDTLAAVSVGVWNGLEVLDLNYQEDRDAEVDFNVVMTGSGQYVEVQGSGEEATFSRTQLDALLELAARGIGTLTDFQRQCLEAAQPSTTPLS